MRELFTIDEHGDVWFMPNSTTCILAFTPRTKHYTEFVKWLNGNIEAKQALETLKKTVSAIYDVDDLVKTIEEAL